MVQQRRTTTLRRTSYKLITYSKNMAHGRHAGQERIQQTQLNHNDMCLAQKEVAAKCATKALCTHNIKQAKVNGVVLEILTSTIRTPGMMGLSGKWPGKKLSLIVTFLMATADSPGLYSITLSTRRKGNLKLNP